MGRRPKKEKPDSNFLNEKQKQLFKYSLSFEDFMRDIVKGDLPDYGLQVKDFHKEWIKLIQENNHVLILAPRRHGKCGHEDSLVTLSDGKTKKIKDCNIGDSVISMTDEYKLVPSKITNVVDNGVKDCFEVTLKSGKKTIVTENHPFFTEDGWKSISDGLSIDDFVTIPRDVNNEELKKPISNDIRWDKIKSIEYVGKHQTYGLEVDKYHNHVIDGIISHNTTVAGSYILWKIVTNPNISVLIVTLNLEMASRMMTFIKNNLDSNDKLIEIFGEQKGNGEWSSNKIRVKTQTVIKKEPTVVVQGWDSHMAGGGYDIIILDDICDATNAASGAVRESMKTWLNSVLFPMVRKQGRLIVIGTRWSFNDIYSYIMDISGFVVNPEWTRDAIVNDEEKKVLWDDEWPWDSLMMKKNQIGSVAFSMQYRNMIISQEDAIIKYDWIQRNLYTEKPPQGLRRYMGVDPAGGKKKVGKEGDYFAAVVIGLDKNNNIYVLDAIHEKTSLSNQVDIVLGLYEKWKPLAIGIESNAMQAFFNEFVLNRAPNLPTKEIKTSTDKASRVSRLSVFFETDRLYVHKNQVDLIDELIQFPYGENDDLSDGLSFAIDVSNQYSMTADWGAHLACISSRLHKPKKPSGFGRLIKTTY